MNGHNGLKDKRVIVLGGSSGIGLATAKAAADAGAQIVIVSGNQQRIDSALAEIGQGTGHAVDLSNEQEIKSLFDQLGSFDHMVYTAGENIKIGSLTDTPLDEAADYFKVRYWGAVASVKYGAPHINTGGSITLTSGTTSVRPGKGWFLGTSICAAMEGFTRAMAVDLSPIRVNIVSPGLVKTNLWNSLPETDRENLYSSYGETLLVKRVGEASDIAQTYLYLMTQQYSTGQKVIVDGGGVLV